MAIEFRLAGAPVTSSANPVAVPFPLTDVQENDIAIAMVGGAHGSTPGESTELDPALFPNKFAAVGSGGAGSGISMVFGWRRCDGTEGETTALIDFSSGAISKAHQIGIYRGCIQTGSPVEAIVTAGQASPAAQNVTCPNTTTLGADRLLLNAVCRRSGLDATTNPPSGWSENLHIPSSGLDTRLVSQAAPTPQEYAGAAFEYASGDQAWVAAAFALIPQPPELPPMFRRMANTLLRM